MTRLLTAISRLLWDTDLVGTRFLLSLGESLWAAMLLWPGDTFSRPTYAHMALVMSEEAWSVVFLVSSVIQITVVLMDDLHSRFARYFAGLNAVLWSYVVVSMLISTYPPPAAIAGEMALALGALWIWIRPYIIVQEYRRARQAYK